MEKSISAFSIQQAFAWLCKDVEEGEQYPKSFIDFTYCSNDDQDVAVDVLKEMGYCIGYCEKQPGTNPNQTQTQVIDTVVKGDKKWKTVYLAVYDTPWGDKVVAGSKSAIKKDCVDIAREAGAKESRDTFVIIGKSPDGFPRCSAQVLYKPSPKQTPGLYKFIW